MHIRWHPEAQLEAAEAARCYGERQPGLEQRFLTPATEPIGFGVHPHPFLVSTIELRPETGRLLAFQS